MQNIPQKIFPTIDLGDIVLREKGQDANDVANFLEYYSDPEVNKYILCEIPQTLDEAKRELYYWRNIFYYNEGLYFAIARKDNNQLIGSIGLTSHNRYQSRVELSYDLARPYWRKGLTMKAVQAMVQYAFDVLKVNRIEAFTSTFNTPSKNLLLKAGFTLEGTLRQHRYHRGKYVDVYIFSLLREDIAV